MKKRIIIALVLMVGLVGIGFSQLRLGVGAKNTYDGVVITDVFYGYPAYGILKPGDIVKYARLVKQSKPVVCDNGVKVLGMHGNFSIHITVDHNPARNIYDSGQFQNLVLSAPVNSTLILTVERYGRHKTYTINLLNDGTVKVFAAN